MKKFLILALIIPVITLFNSHSVSATPETYYYTQAIVDFWTDHQVDATVNLPWNANPGTNNFWLHNVWANDTHYNGQSLAFVSGRAVMELRNFGMLPDGSIAGNNLYLCGIGMNQLSYDTGNAVGTNCFGSITIVYTDNTQTKSENINVFYNWTATTMSGVIYFDYATQLNSAKQIQFIQYRFYGQTGYDLIARTASWYNVNLFTLFQVRASIDAYQDMSGVSADLLQQQLQQSQQTYNYITDTTAPNANTSALGGASGWLPPGPVDSILTLPVQLAQGIVNVFTNPGQCTPLNIPLPWVDYTLTLPCVGPLMDQIGFSPIWATIGGIISAFIIYDTLKWLYKFVDDTLTLRENNSGMWGGL